MSPQDFLKIAVREDEGELEKSRVKTLLYKAISDLQEFKDRV